MTTFDDDAPDSESDKGVGEPGEGIPKDLIGSLVRRVKSRGPRKKRVVSSPFIVVKRKKLVEVPSSNIDDIVQHIYESSTPITIPSPRLDEAREKETGEAWEEVQSGATVPYESVLPSSAIEFPDRELLPSNIQQVIDSCLRMYKERDDLIIAQGHIHISQIDLEALWDNKEIGVDHVDLFAIGLENHRRQPPNSFRPYLYLSLAHWGFRDHPLRDIVVHIIVEAVAQVEAILIPIVNNRHWTLLVGNQKDRKWRFYNSLPNKMHLGVTRDVIRHLHKDAGNAFHSDPSKWDVSTARGISTQTNSVDYGIFVCKYMKTLVQKGKNNWKDFQDWQAEMPRFRAEIVYEI
ncbi:uncharacterized protein LOC110035824 [Phalaenopsis equestris]|uniref:uncharacterized protein LOC110035824 n=1 Tax=Phalaenopsis equestris TaxID=78828 RepID=UPI0009E5B44D|nr:uncharacterized protein LOC110035824 [Phalaenopsis equestris]